MALIALALVGAGLIAGQVWARRGGRLWAAGSARPGMVAAALAALLGALFTAVRGAWAEAVVLGLVSFGLAVGARKRSLAPRAPRARAETVPDAPAMSRAQAADLLGVSVGAVEPEVRAAYLRLIRFAHPDQGGTAGLAAQLNAARDVLLGG